MNIQNLVAATKYTYGNTAPNDNIAKYILILLIVEKMDAYLDDEDGPISTLMLESAEVGRDVARALRHVDLSSMRSRRSYPDKTMYICKNRCDCSWLIEKNMSSRWTNGMAVCPYCGIEIEEMEDQNRGYELIHTYVCQCAEVIYSDWNSDEADEFYCNCCGDRGLITLDWGKG